MFPTPWNIFIQHLFFSLAAKCTDNPFNCWTAVLQEAPTNCFYSGKLLCLLSFLQSMIMHVKHGQEKPTGKCCIPGTRSRMGLDVMPVLSLSAQKEAALRGSSLWGWGNVEFYTLQTPQWSPVVLKIDKIKVWILSIWSTTGFVSAGDIVTVRENKACAIVAMLCLSCKSSEVFRAWLDGDLSSLV